MGKQLSKNDAVKDFFEHRDILTINKKHEKAVVANSRKMHQLDKKLTDINQQISDIDNKPKRRHMRPEEVAASVTVGTLVPLGIALGVTIGALTTSQSAHEINEAISTVVDVSAISTLPVAMATYFCREHKLIGRTFDALKKRSLRKKASKVQLDINRCKIYQIGLTGQEEPLAEEILDLNKEKMPTNNKKAIDPNFQYLDNDITEDTIEEYVDLQLN